jgi:hypothetical protein
MNRVDGKTSGKTHIIFPGLEEGEKSGREEKPGI